MGTNTDESLALQKGKAVKALREQAAKYECEIVDMKEQFDQIEGEKKLTVEYMQNQRALQKRIIYLKSRYADNNASVKMDPGTKSVFENEYNIHSGCSERLQKELDEANKQLEATTDCLEKTRGFLIQLMNEQILELNKLKKELETFKNQEEKSKWSSREKMKSWINKKVLRSVQVAPLFEEKLPSLYPLDWHPPADVSTSDDDLFSSSPQDCMDERITYVMPFVDDEL
ncbi:hypothetical protein Q8A73_022953 [Channa argus]|nr:hypothetical protein Q8A73_022953 [Channa argus]